MTELIWLIIKERGIRLDWLAQQLEIDPSYVSKLKSGERRWTAKLRAEAARVLMLPEEILFLKVEQMELAGLDVVEGDGA